MNTEAQKFYIGMDNGVSGSIAIIDKLTGILSMWCPTPIRKKQLNYTKEKKFLTRIDAVKLKELLSPYGPTNSMLYLERPMINPKRWVATVSALRALEATLIVIEELNIPYEYIDSKAWQKKMLPHGLKGSDELKEASKQVASRLFPIAECKAQDGDAVLIAEWARRYK